VRGQVDVNPVQNRIHAEQKLLRHRSQHRKVVTRGDENLPIAPGSHSAGLAEANPVEECPFSLGWWIRLTGAIGHRRPGGGGEGGQIVSNPGGSHTFHS
jgi:hypothetical protein